MYSGVLTCTEWRNHWPCIDNPNACLLAYRSPLVIPPMRLAIYGSGHSGAGGKLLRPRPYIPYDHRHDPVLDVQHHGMALWGPRCARAQTSALYPVIANTTRSGLNALIVAFLSGNLVNYVYPAPLIRSPSTTALHGRSSCGPPAAKVLALFSPLDQPEEYHHGLSLLQPL